MNYDDDHRVTIAPGSYPGLAEAISAAGYTLECNNNLWYADDAQAVQPIIDGYPPAAALAYAKAPLVARVKALAYDKIIAFLPVWKQSNFNARMNELNDARFSRELTTDENAEIDAMRIQWDRAKAIRAASDAHEAALGLLDDLAALASHDLDAGWPQD